MPQQKPGKATTVTITVRSFSGQTASGLFRRTRRVEPWVSGVAGVPEVETISPYDDICSLMYVNVISPMAADLVDLGNGAVST